ncbi:LOW QUALITY PROTEIN: hypothetical protein Cgig2_023066 [Carnegiea gigantea]|uniref:Uncharacterized protein n=1 Tax=Carnegiea gigantea TaxID=171969 RepID=A0A9Q1GXB2_9CARY|nr:LOW QUALITY PROTEIN: hypothetical protein Cgig2_023066 [Carnegiea gigantea]
MQRRIHNQSCKTQKHNNDRENAILKISKSVSTNAKNRLHTNARKISNNTLEKTVTDIHEQTSKETDGTIEDSNYKRSPHGYQDGADPKEELLMSLARFIRMIEKFNETHQQGIMDMVTELLRDLCKWLMDSFEPYSVTLCISSDKKIKIALMDVPLTLALPIDGRRFEELHGKNPKDPDYNIIISIWRRERCHPY